MREFLSRVVIRAGCTRRPVMDVAEAIECLEHSPGVAAAIIDMLFVNSGGRSGLDVLEYVRGNSRLQELPVIVLTGFSLNHSVTAEVQALQAELWHKAINAQALVQRLDQLIHPPDPPMSEPTSEPAAVKLESMQE